MRKISHIVNPVKVDASSDLHAAQPVVFETMRRAKTFAQGIVDVALHSAQYFEDADFVPDDFNKTRNLEQSVLDIDQFRVTRKLPFLKDVLDRLYDESDAEYFVYTNVDIGLMPHFYLAVNRIIDAGHDAFVVNRRTIAEKYADAPDIPLMYSEIGKDHKGYDCFVFKKDAYPRYRLGRCCLGAAWVGRILIWNLALFSQNFKEFKESHLTFHIGNSSIWRNEKYSDYTVYNRKEACRILAEFEKDFGGLERLEIHDLLKGFKSAEAKSGTKKILFVAGLHKSGTSILFKCIREHPSISGFHGTNVPQDEGQFLQTVFPPAKQFGGPGAFGFNSSMHLTESSPLATDGNKEKLYSEWSRFWDTLKPVLLEKSPPNLLKTRFLQSLFPGSFFAAIIRHPIPVSYSTRQWSRTSLMSLLFHWLQCHRIFLEDKVLLRNCFVLRYEDFVRRPDEWLGKIYDFIGVERHPVRPEVAKESNDKHFRQWAADKKKEDIAKFLRGPDALEMEKEFRKFGYSLYEEGEHGVLQQDDCRIDWGLQKEFQTGKA